MNKKKLSIVIPVYNAERHIPGLLDMLRRQTSHDFEAVFVNDGSADASLEMLRTACEAGDFDAVVIDQPNGGASAARNAGIAAASGEYVTFADADDVLSDDFVRGYIEGAVKDGVSVFMHTRVVESKPHFDAGDGSVRVIDADTALKIFMQNPTRFGVYDIVADRKLLSGTEVNFPEGYPYYEDYDFIIKLFCACGSISFIEKCFYCYKAAEGSAMNTFNKERLRCLQLFDNIDSLYCGGSMRGSAEYMKQFQARLRWSVLWQACVSMPVFGALKACGGRETRRAMRMLIFHPDKKVALSAAVYLVCPLLYAIIMRRMGKRRTLIPVDARK